MTRDLTARPHRKRRELSDRAGKKCAACEIESRRDRVPSRNGGWPSSGAPPGPPAIGFLIPALNDPSEPAPVFGQYPKNLIAHLLPVLRCRRDEILHVCSGSLRTGEGVRVDIRREQRPDVISDGRALPFRSGSCKAVMIDPPYTEQYAADLYGVEYPRPSHLLREAARVVRPCGRIAFVHYITPNPPPGCVLIASFGVLVGYGFPARTVTIFEREQGRLL